MRGFLFKMLKSAPFFDPTSFLTFTYYIQNIFQNQKIIKIYIYFKFFNENIEVKLNAEIE